jgi:hypothetical protein
VGAPCICQIRTLQMKKATCSHIWLHCHHASSTLPATFKLQQHKHVINFLKPLKAQRLSKLTLVPSILLT